MTPDIYVVSKIKHAPMWRELRAQGTPIVSSWIDDGSEYEMDFEEAWPRYLREAATAKYILVYCEPGEELKGGLLEIGAGLGGGALVLIVGVVPAMRTAREHVCVYDRIPSVAAALARITELKMLEHEL